MLTVKQFNGETPEPRTFGRETATSRRGNLPSVSASLRLQVSTRLFVSFVATAVPRRLRHAAPVKQLTLGERTDWHDTVRGNWRMLIAHSVLFGAMPQHCGAREYVLHCAWAVIIAAAIAAVLLTIRLLHRRQFMRVHPRVWSDHLFEATVVGLIEGSIVTFAICQYFT
jgi:hypothetical protein